MASPLAMDAASAFSRLEPQRRGLDLRRWTHSLLGRDVCSHLMVAAAASRPAAAGSRDNLLALLILLSLLMPR